MSDLEHHVARMICCGFSGTSLPDSMRELLDRGVCSVILFSRNYESPTQLAGLTEEIKSAAGHPILICIDQEGGRVQRLGAPFTGVPCMRTLGQRGRVDEVRQIGQLMARELRFVHIDMNLAPVLDVDSNPANPVIGERSFGADPQNVAQLGCALIEGLQGSPDRLAACAKHFPGHGDTSIDSHLDLPTLDHDLARLEAIELPPFAAAVDAGVAAIMTSHILFRSLDSDLPATMSPTIIEGLLRHRLGFDGVVVSDDLEMNAIVNHFGVEQAVVRGAAAGVDLFLVCHRSDRQHAAINALLNAVADGIIPLDRISQANRRLDSLFDQFVRPSCDSTDLLQRPAARKS